MQRRLQDSDTIIFEHVQQRRLAGIVEAKEEQLGVLVEQAQRGENVPDY